MHSIEINDYVSGEKFIGLADTPYNKLNSNDSLSVSLADRVVIYAHTHNASRFLKQVNPDQKIVFVTHNSDGKVTRHPNHDDADVRLQTPGIIKWFGANIIDHNEKTVSLPTGLENSCWFPEINKQRRIHEINSTEKKHRNLCYMNFNVRTNYDERQYLYSKLSKEKWVTTVRGENGLDFSAYLDNIYNHVFVLCPEGNSNGHPVPGGGTASHRFWETLYANTIPILTKGSQSDQFRDLPALFIDSWDQVTEQFLLEQYEIFKTKQFNYDKLKMSYWKEQILGFKNE